MTKLTPADRARLRALAEQATTGPWESTGAKFGCLYVVSNSGMIADKHDDLDYLVRMRGHGAGLPQEANADFIAAANPHAVLALLDAADERDRLRARVTELESALVKSRHAAACRIWFGENTCTCGLAAALKGHD